MTNLTHNTQQDRPPDRPVRGDGPTTGKGSSRLTLEGARGHGRRWSVAQLITAARLGGDRPSGA
jgi:hypothetical protein